MKVLTVVGNRPQFIKAAAVSGALRAQHEEVLVHTGQHHDDELSRIFFEELELPRPDHQLNIHSGSNTDQTARQLAALEPLTKQVAPDVVLVYGDTNSTLAGGLVAAQAGVPVAHVEAGMRSFDMTMPEELNRVLCDHLSALLLCPSQTAVDNLAREAVAGRVELVGDVMVDVANIFQPRARERTEVLARHGLAAREYVLVTVHRAGNVDDAARLERVVQLLEGLEGPVVFPLHPRTAKRLAEAGLRARLDAVAGLQLVAPAGYLEFTALLCLARRVLTDSGGVQKEAYFAGVPCVTLRPSTEWVETVDSGWNVLVDLDKQAALAALERPVPPEHPPLYGDGRAGARVVEALSGLTLAR